MPVHGRAENAFNEMIENAVVIVLLVNQLQPFVVPFNRATDGVAQIRRRERFPRQIILRAVEHDLGGEIIVVHRPEHHHRQARRLGRERRDLKQAGGVRLGQVE